MSCCKPSHISGDVPKARAKRWAMSVVTGLRSCRISRRTVSEILHERRPVTTDMAHRLARAFGTSPEMWLGLQQDIDLWDTHHARRKEYERIKRIPTSKAA